MQSWAKLAMAVAVPGAAIFSVILAAVCLHCRRRQKLPSSDSGLPGSNSTMAMKESMCFYRSDTAGFRFHHLDRPHRDRSRRHQHHHRQLHPRSSDFSWDDHPVLIEEAVEGGWSRFAFMGRSNSLARSASLLGSCVACDHGRPPWAGTEVGWEVPAGSSEFLQTVRLDPGDGSIPVDGKQPLCVARMSLPLPGPPLSADSPFFPQEAYFEITIMHLQRPQRPQQLPKRWSKRVKDKSSEADRRKLMNQDDPSHAAFSANSAQEQEPKIFTEERSSGKEVADAIIWVGLTRGGTPTESTPGSHLGSIGFNSNGSVYLEGIKLVLESESGRWGAVNKVVGCGFDPGRKTVFFTMDSILLHVVRCRSDAFGGPLYPTLVANADAMVTVNLGQFAFRYPPANAHRTPNPCFLRPSASAHIRYDDSRELFSMGRIDSQWRDIVSSRKTRQVNGSSGCKDDNAAEDREEEEDRADGGEGMVVVDIDAESDLFEISLNK
ncbi:hypothetical protein Taro_033694 [Colocasia esculenta]|uniref:SPRY domain-containing protein n=1 Tax=Colocasia esculenta TaxID=4460 RepID=A0A843WD86_COLES|nr:hypothetical protein [Colocasia esculenta]